MIAEESNDLPLDDEHAESLIRDMLNLPVGMAVVVEMGYLEGMGEEGFKKLVVSRVTGGYLVKLDADPVIPMKDIDLIVAAIRRGVAARARA